MTSDLTTFYVTQTFQITEGIASLLYGMVSLFVLVNSCQAGTLKVQILELRFFNSLTIVEKISF